MVDEILAVFAKNFKSVEKTYKYFLKDSKNDYIFFEDFKRGLNALFPERFYDSDIKALFNKIKDTDHDYVTFQEFVTAFDSSKKSTASVPSLINNNNNNQDIKTNSEEIFQTDKLFQPSLQTKDRTKQLIDRVKQILRSCNKTPTEIFQEFDKDGSGEISNLEFRSAFKALNLGLSFKDIDELMIYCDTNADGVINGIEFAKMLEMSELQEKIVERCKARLRIIKANIYSYMISPKDAFRLFDLNRNGQILFEHFYKFIVRLCQLSGEELYPFLIIKDLFDFIDIRKDNCLDLTEWMQTFRHIDKSEKPFKVRAITAAKRKIFHTFQPFRETKINSDNSAKILASYNVHTDTEDRNKWEISHQYDDIIKIFGRNRKYIMNLFSDIEKRRGKEISFDLTKDVLSCLLRSVGIALPDEYWPYLIKFAEREGIIDYKFMMEVYKERIGRCERHPKAPKKKLVE